MDFHKLAKDALGQGNDLQSLGKVQIAKSHLQDAKILFENALAMHQQAQDPVEQEKDQHYLNETLSKISETLRV